MPLEEVAPGSLYIFYGIPLTTKNAAYSKCKECGIFIINVESLTTILVSAL